MSIEFLASKSQKVYTFFSELLHIFVRENFPLFAKKLLNWFAISGDEIIQCNITFPCRFLFGMRFCVVQARHISNTVKNIMGFNKRSHHSNLLHAVRIDKVETSVIRGILSLWYRIYQVDNPARVLSNAMLRDYVNSRHLIPGTLIHRVVEAGFSPIKSLSIKQQFTAHRANNIHDGIVDSLRHLIYHENFVKPYSEEHILATLLVKAF